MNSTNMYEDGLFFLQKIVSLMIPKNSKRNLPEIRVPDFLEYLRENGLYSLSKDVMISCKKLQMAWELGEKDVDSCTLDDLFLTCKEEFSDLEKIVSSSLLNYYFSLTSTLKWVGVEPVAPVLRTNHFESSFQDHSIDSTKGSGP